MSTFSDINWKEYFSSSKIGWGFTLLFFGLLFTIKQLGMFGDDCWLYDPKFFALYVGIIMFLSHNLRTAGIFMLIAALTHLKFVIGTFKDYSQFAIPAIITIVGIAILFYSFTGKK